MKKSQIGLDSKNKKVVRLQLDAGFFFERAVRSLDRHRYDKAVKYFRLAMEKEPDNPVNHCNLAGVLSELGRYEESNEILETVLTDVDPDLYECLFYMANNSTNMGEYELAEDYLLEYLSLDPEGEYAEDAEEMLEMVAYEMGRPPREPVPAALPAYMQKHEEARLHLEEGRFLQAIELLEELVEEKPDFLAASNNLALAYYYTGRMEEAMKCIGRVLEADPANLHALCNLAVLSCHMGEGEVGRQIIDTLKKLVPFHKEHTYKLATTLGILGEHPVAFELFVRLLKVEDQPDASLYHYAAAAACNTGRLSLAQKYWKKASALDPDSDVARFYLGQIDEWLNRGETVIPTVSYHYHLPFEEQMMRVDQDGSNHYLIAQLKSNPLLRSSFFWALDHGDHQTKLQVLHVLGWVGDSEVEQLLRQFLLRPEEDDELKKAALLILRHLQAQPPYVVWLEDRMVELGEEESTEPVQSREERWGQVLECCLSGMKEYSTRQQSDAKMLWSEFTRKQLPDLPIVRKVEAWAAAFEYVVAKHHGLSLTQTRVAEKYEVSPSTVARNVKQLAPVAQKCLKV
ncbi:tetratricopeptide repeat protein [Paenactinomyces guangxiensis]|uniref:Tetratricopeptide repeat protein n=1 Tax=Paenactinomyces guangxiensis TaxID=1490290 RepID=A0A7W2A9Y0_9BACL|nr:tetratricopeptide repeat protein [Paenactinomyces guangxiensis]MBA4496205.1 tetratricopeptide repeat protein [Paenactinomyces guangxiensis]MBH8593294.1 tetratricopeptide repeat protein [Paenactinomyces guangxiensis]